MSREGLSKLDIATTLAILTAYSYGLSYAVQLQKCKYYRIPDMFIDLNINALTKTGFWALLVFIIISFTLFSLFAGAGNRLEHLREDPNIVINLLLVKIKKHIPDRASASLVLTVLFFLPFLFATIFGQLSAYTKDKYMIVKEKEDYFIAVGSYKENVIFAPFNNEKQSMKPKFRLVEFKELKNVEVITLKWPLKVDELRNVKKLNNTTDVNKRLP